VLGVQRGYYGVSAIGLPIWCWLEATAFIAFHSRPAWQSRHPDDWLNVVRRLNQSPEPLPRSV